MSKYDYLIVGAGLFGAVAAYRAARSGKKALVIDRRPHTGGNAYCEEREGIRVHKYGAHIFHTSNREVWEFVNRFVEFNNYINSPVANYKGKLYNLPFNMNTFYAMWGVTTPAQAAEMIDRQRREAGISEPRNLEEQAISLVGIDIYERLVKGYTEKQVYDAFRTSVQLIFDEHPEIFWLDTMQNIVVSDDHNTLTFYPRPTSAYGTADKEGTKASKLNTTAIKNTASKMNAAVKKMGGSNTYEQVKAIHDAIVNGTQYPADPNKATHNQHQAVGPLVEGKAVCDGYAKAFKYACDQKGIPCIIVTGTATNNLGEKGTHAWNYVKMDDGKWYQVDTDWDDPQTKGGNSKSVLIYDYFMTGAVKNDKRVKDATMKYPALATANYKAK